MLFRGRSTGLKVVNERIDTRQDEEGGEGRLCKDLGQGRGVNKQRKRERSLSFLRG